MVGDTFTLLTSDNREIKVRLHGIDCPEKNQDFWLVAKKILSDLIYGKTVHVKDMDTDRYGRTIGVVTIGYVNVNEELQKAGLAWHYKKYDNDSQWAEIEAEARQAKRGLWVNSDAMPPWDWRKYSKGIIN